MSAFIWHEKESRRTAHQRRKQEREVKAQQTQAFLSNVTSGVEPPPFDLVLDQNERRLQVPAGCMGLVIGKKGEHLKSVEKDFKVTVHIEKDDTSSDNILLISGASPAEVAAAVKALDFDMRTLEVPKEIAGWVCGKAGRHLKLVREMTGVAVLSMKDMDKELQDGREDQSGLSSVSSRCSLEIKGLRESVEAAAMCMEAHMSYHSVFQEMEQVEKDLDQRIADAKGRLSRRAVAAPHSGPGPETSSFHYFHFLFVSSAVLG
ncbi:FXR2 [Symbiodinium natans]|uniref:FXR2 protein n=1 Tax=Symbiodinium natans TaxID=878477 RepID=A0A812IM64_9DINO|nr:FXR2 [Symbiodinium natans]